MKNRIAVILMFGFVIIGTSQETQFSFRAGYVNAFGKLTIENVVILESPEDSYFEGNRATEKDNVGCSRWCRSWIGGDDAIGRPSSGARIQIQHKRLRATGPFWRYIRADPLELCRRGG